MLPHDDPSRLVSALAGEAGEIAAGLLGRVLAGGEGRSAVSQFLGTHTNRLDAKGRTSVPAAFRNALRKGDDKAAAALVLRPSHQYACIEAWPADIFHSLAYPIETLNIFSSDQDDLTTALYADAYPVEADKEGRVVLPELLVQHANLTDSVVFMGLGRLFQIWEPEAGARRSAEARERARARGLSLPGRTPAP